MKPRTCPTHSSSKRFTR